MNKAILIIMFCSLFCFLHKNTVCYGDNIKVVINGSSLTINNGDNKFIAEITSDYKENLRIYGINDNNMSGWFPLAYAAYIFVAGPFTGNAKNCERNDADSAPLLNIIVENKDIKDKIEKLKKMEGRRTAIIIGKNITIKKFFYKDEDHTDALQIQPRCDPHYAIMITDIITQ